MTYQLRYIAYANSHHLTPEQMLAHDEFAWPGGKMCGFILFISHSWRSWQKYVGRKNLEFLCDHDHMSFDSWLLNTYPSKP